ncbi:hypothetical protein Tco_0702865 [Tanacetum coccineum]|uniref:Reverse transcriptase domain-containing protein n=1 Tax=Tanacetum coccineum TaxID=301880 RepID=A0ABQ4XX76_9ASTR
MYVDGGPASEIMYEHFFNKLLPEVKRKMVPATAPLIGFSGEIIWPLGQISLLVKISDEEHSTLALMNFVVVRSASPYNEIIGRPGIRKIQAVPSTAHGMNYGTISCHQTCSGRKNKGSNKPRVSRADGVPRHVAEHRLNFREGCPPIRQEKRGQAVDRNKAI